MQRSTSFQVLSTLVYLRTTRTCMIQLRLFQQLNIFLAAAFDRDRVSFQPTAQPTKCDVLCVLRAFGSPRRSCKSCETCPGSIDTVARCRPQSTDCRSVASFRTRPIASISVSNLRPPCEIGRG